MMLAGKTFIIDIVYIFACKRIDLLNKTLKSLRCQDCDKIFVSEREASLHATQTQHVNFIESTQQNKSLTAQEKAHQLEKLKEKIAEKKVQRQEADKKEAIEKVSKTKTTTAS